MNRTFPLFVAIILTVFLSQQSDAAVSYIADNGTGGRGVGCDTFEPEIIEWANQFDASAQGSVLTSVHVAFGAVVGNDAILDPSGMIGYSVTITIYDDDNNDGLPNNAPILTQVTGTISNYQSDNFDVFDIPETKVTGKFFVSVSVTVPGKNATGEAANYLPARLDTGPNNGRSWARSVCTPDGGWVRVNPLGGNFMIRADATALTKGQMAVVRMLLNNSVPSGNALSSFAPSLAPSGNLIASAVYEDGTQLSILGQKDDTGVVAGVSSYSLNSPDSASSLVELDVDASGRPLVMSSPLGLVEFDYSVPDEIRVTETNSDGSVREYTIESPVLTPIPSLARTAGASVISGEVVQACDVAFGYEPKKGKVTFACDNEYLDFGASVLGDGLYRPTFMALDVLSQDGSKPIANGEIALDPDAVSSQPEKSLHIYQYSVDYPTNTPTFEEWESCCNQIFNDPLSVNTSGANTLAVLQAVNDGLTAGNALICLKSALTVVASCKAAAISILLDKVVNLFGPSLCADNVIFEQSQFTDQFDIATLRFNKYGVANGGARYIQENVNLSFPPDFVIGPTPPRSEGLGGTTAFRVNESFVVGDLIEERDGKLVVFDGDAGEYIDAPIEVGERLKFRMFDEFYDRSQPNSLSSRIDTQHYECGVYGWTLYRNEEVVESGDQPGVNDGWITDPLQPGSYRMCGAMQNNTLSGYTADSEYVSPDGEQWLSTSQPIIDDCVNFKVPLVPVCSSWGATSTNWSINCDNGYTESLRLIDADTEEWEFKVTISPPDGEIEHPDYGPIRFINSNFTLFASGNIDAGISVRAKFRVSTNQIINSIPELEIQNNDSITNGYFSDAEVRTIRRVESKSTYYPSPLNNSTYIQTTELCDYCRDQPAGTFCSGEKRIREFQNGVLVRNDLWAFENDSLCPNEFDHQAILPVPLDSVTGDGTIIFWCMNNGFTYADCPVEEYF